MYHHMEIFKKVDVIVTPTTGYVKLINRVNDALLMNLIMIYNKSSIEEEFGYGLLQSIPKLIQMDFVSKT